MKCLLMALMSAVLIMPVGAFAQSMSELDIKGFDKKQDEVRVDRAKSPFSPVTPSPEDLMIEDLYLTGVAVGDGRSYALISGFIVTEGDSVAGLKVRSISRNKVVLQHLDKVHTLHLQGGL